MLRPSTGLSPLIRAQMEKLTGHRESIFSSSMIIPRKSNQCTISTTNIFETSTIRQNDDKDDDDHDDGSLPMLPSSGQPLEHSAARDRIQLKNRKNTGSQLKINEQEEERCTSLTISQPHQHSIVKSKLAAPFSLIDLSDLQTAANNLRHRTRERSVDNLLLSTMPLERSKRSESTIYLTKTEEKDEKHPSSPEHIYDNFDFSKHSKNQSVEDLTSKATPLRDHPPVRRRPVTMFVSNEQEKSSNNELDNVFNQLKKRSANRKIQPDRDFPRPIETVFPLPIEKKVSDESPPTPTWIDIAKQKQTKFNTIFSDIYPPKPSNNEPLDISSSPTIERIRPTRTGTSSRINSLIQFFNK